MTVKKARAAGIAAVSLALALTACGGGGSSTPKDSDALASFEASGAPERENLGIAWPSAVVSADPLTASSQPDCMMVHLVGGNLFEFSADSHRTQPALAESGSFGPGNTSYELTLRPNAKFSDGSVVSPADVIATIDRALHYKANAYASQFTPITEVKESGPNKVSFTFNRPFPSFTTLMAYPSYAILKKSEIKPDGTVPAVPTFAGAYIPRTNTLAGNKFSLQRNDAYVGTMPSVKTLDFTVIGDPAARYSQSAAGQYDFAYDVPFPTLKGSSGKLSAQTSTAYGFSYLAMNNNDSLLKDVKIRQAISLAVDRAKIAQVAFSGVAQPLGGFFSTAYGDVSVKAKAPDVTAAKKELAGTACESGCNVSLLVPSGLAWAGEAGTLVQSALAAIGISVDVQTQDANTVIGKIFGLEYQMALSYFTDYSAAPEGMPAYCMSPAAGFLACGTGYDSAKATSAVDAAAQAAGDAQLQQRYGDIQKLYAEDAPFVALTDYIWDGTVVSSASGSIAVLASGLLQIAPLKK